MIDHEKELADAVKRLKELLAEAQHALGAISVLAYINGQGKENAQP